MDRLIKLSPFPSLLTTVPAHNLFSIMSFMFFISFGEIIYNSILLFFIYFAHNWSIILLDLALLVSLDTVSIS